MSEVSKPDWVREALSMILREGLDDDGDDDFSVIRTSLPRRAV